MLLLDEPTQGVDIAAKVILHDQIRSAAASGSAVMISTVDHEELLSLFSRVIVLNHGVATAELAGTDLTAAGLGHATLGEQGGSA